MGEMRVSVVCGSRCSLLRDETHIGRLHHRPIPASMWSGMWAEQSEKPGTSVICEASMLCTLSEEARKGLETATDQRSGTLAAKVPVDEHRRSLRPD